MAEGAIAPDPKLLRDACRLAVAVARDGELAEPRVPAPGGVRSILQFTRMSSAAYAIVRRSVDEDEAFRRRVAAAATDDEVGRAGWLWLHRPDGWEADSALEAPDEHDRGRGMARLRRERDGAEAAAARHQAAAAGAEAKRQRLEEKLNRASAEASEAIAAGQVLQARLALLEVERSEAVRALKVAEEELARMRRDLRLARESTRQTEAEVLAGGLADDIASDPLWPPAGMTAGQSAGPPKARAPKRSRQTRTVLPAGLFTGTPEADRHLLMSGKAVVVVDGYNLARAAWSGLEPVEERRRTVALLEEVQARSGGVVEVVFDGADGMVAPVASRSVRVRFSPTGVTADEAISALLATVHTEAAVVVSSDREVADDARGQGALVLGSHQFLVAAGR